MGLGVVDASVILTWIVGKPEEPEYDHARRLLMAWQDGGLDLAAPSLWVYEVGNFLGRQRPRQADELMAALLDLRLRTVELTLSMYHRCFAWMADYGVTFYDAAYLAVAAEMGGTLITADEKFARRLNHPPNLRLLKNLAEGWPLSPQ